MKKILIALVILFSMTFVLRAQNNKKVVGVWKYEVKQAPYGYETGTLEVKELKNQLSGEVKFSPGNSVKLQKLTLSNDTLRANAFVDSESVDIVAKISTTKMEGSVNTSMGRLTLKADKVIENKK